MGVKQCTAVCKFYFWHPEQEQPATEWKQEIDQLIDLQEQTFDENKRISYFHEIQKIWAEELPAMYLVSPNLYHGLKNKMAKT